MRKSANAKYYTGSAQEISWDREERRHTCCGSKRANYHKGGCPRNTQGLKRTKNTAQSYVDPISGNEIRYNQHPRRKNNHIVAAMYAMYQTGKSLDEVARRYRRTRQAVYDIFRTRGYQLRSKRLNGLQVLDGYNFTLTKGGYLRGTVNGQRLLMHRYVWEKHHGPLPEEHVLHHLDGDPTNNAIENLQLVHRSKMAKTFNPKGNNQYGTKN